MKIKCYYIKNLKMSPEKLSSQVGHVTKQLGRSFQLSSPEDDIIVVLGVSATKFNNLLDEVENSDKLYYIQKDIGLTEVEAGTITCFGYIESI